MVTCLEKMKCVWTGITIEPLAFVTMMIVFLSDISTQELYLQKACQVNLGHSAEMCANMTENEQLLEETQEYVAGVQAYNVLLQRLPSVVFIVLAGPLSDTYGRKPLLILPLVGFFLLNLIYLINVTWFQQLKVEYLLFECLQDFTGGRQIFGMATKCFIMDVTSDKNRTARLCLLEAAMGLAIMLASPLGTMMKNGYGYIALYSFTLSLVTVTLIYSFFLKDSIHLVSEEKKAAMLKEKENADIKCDKGVFYKVPNMIIETIKALVRMRPQRKHIWCLISINIIATAAGELAAVLFLFYKLQYGISTETFGWMMSAWACGTFISQLLVVPFLSVKLKLRDTTLIIMALASNALDYFLETVMNQVWFLFLSCGVLQMLWSVMFTTVLSAVSKLVEPTETGKLLTVVSLINMLVSLGAAPAYNLIYQATLKTHPAIAIYIGVLLFLIGMGLAIYTHIDMKKNRK